jgi:hypothetical protein
VLLTSCKGADHEKPPNKIDVAFAGATHKFGTCANPQGLG